MLIHRSYSAQNNRTGPPAEVLTHLHALQGSGPPQLGPADAWRGQIRRLGSGRSRLLRVADETGAGLDLGSGTPAVTLCSPDELWLDLLRDGWRTKRRREHHQNQNRGFRSVLMDSPGSR